MCLALQREACPPAAEDQAWAPWPSSGQPDLLAMHSWWSISAADVMQCHAMSETKGAVNMRRRASGTIRYRLSINLERLNGSAEEKWPPRFDI